jgi:tetratricopeptide (TPR) repeat protein
MELPRTILCALGMAALLLCAPAGVAEELAYPGADFAKLDTFEGVNLGDADKLFAAGDFKGAYAAYKAYSFEFAKSKATAYVLLRMGRCQQKLEKRHAAIQAYQDVVDYFPNDTAIAAAALYHIGECHGLNGEVEKQGAVWARMVKDDGYVAQPNSGTALAFLAGEMTKLGKFEEAVAYAWRTAVAFRTRNQGAAAAARNEVVAHYATRSPNHDKLKEFYIAAGGFEGRGNETDNPENDARYWSTALGAALRMTGDAAKKDSACAYWSANMGDRFVENDDLRMLWSDALLVPNKDRAAWAARMDKQYQAKPATLERLKQWLEYFRHRQDPASRTAFFTKHGQPLVAGLDPAARIALMKQMIHPYDMAAEARTLMRTISPDNLSDTDLVGFAGVAAGLNESEETVLRVFARMKDKLAAAKARFDYYNSRSHRNRPFMEKALAEIPALKQSPAYAGQELVWAEAVLLQGLGRYDDAIKAFRAANKQPASTWEIADCMVALKQYDQAVTTVREIESVGGATAAAASLKAADIYRASGDKGREVGQLRTVLKRYPKSPESSQAHNRLESYGVALTGGESETDP